MIVRLRFVSQKEAFKDTRTKRKNKTEKRASGTDVLLYTYCSTTVLPIVFSDSCRSGFPKCHLSNRETEFRLFVRASHFVGTQTKHDQVTIQAPPQTSEKQRKLSRVGCKSCSWNVSAASHADIRVLVGLQERNHRLFDVVRRSPWNRDAVGDSTL